jgi:hypothetical protein
MVAGVVIAALLIAAVPFSGFAQTGNDQIGTGDELDCGNFLAGSEGGQEHAQDFYNADRQDLYGLDGPRGPNNDTVGEPDVPCETESDLGRESPAACGNFQEQSHAQALLDTVGGEDLYPLDLDNDGTACNGGDTAPPGTLGSSGAGAPDVLDENPLPSGEASALGVQESEGELPRHPYVAYIAAGGVPIGAHTFDLVSQGQVATASGESTPITRAQTADDGSRIHRGHDRQKAKHSKNSGGKKHKSKQHKKK